MPESIYPDITISSLDEAIDRFRAFARAHADFEPTLATERDAHGRRRYSLSVTRRTEADRVAHRRAHGPSREEAD